MRDSLDKIIERNVASVISNLNIMLGDSGIPRNLPLLQDISVLDELLVIICQLIHLKTNIL